MFMGGMQAVTLQQRDDDTLLATESALVEKAVAGDQSAFEQLYRSHCDRVYALCWRMCGGDKSVADDMMQEAFARAWNKLELFRGDSKFGTWLHRLTVNVILSDKRIRVKRLYREQELSAGAERSLAGLQDVTAGLRKVLEQAIGSLPERARSVLVLYDIARAGWSHVKARKICKPPGRGGCFRQWPQQSCLIDFRYFYRARP